MDSIRVTADKYTTAGRFTKFIGNWAIGQLGKLAFVDLIDPALCVNVPAVIRGMRQRPFFRDAISQGWGVIFVGTAVRMGLNFITGILLARALGPDEFGIYSILGAIAGISGGVIDLGLTSASVRHIAIDWQTDKTLAWQRGQTFFWLRVILAAVYIVGGILLAKPITQLVWPVPNAALLLSLALLSMGTTVLSGSINALLEATRYFGRIAIAIIFSSTVSLSVTAVLVVTGQISVITALVGSSFFGSLAGFWLATRLWPVLWRETAVSRPILRFPGIQTMRTLGQPLWKFGGWLWLGNILRMLLGYLDMFLVNHWLATETVGIYALALNLSSKVELINSSLHAALVPSVSTLADKTAVRHYLKQSLVRSAGLSLPVLALVPLAPWFVPQLYGPAYQSAGTVLQLLLLITLFDLFTLAPSLLVYTFNQPKLFAAGELLRTLTLLAMGVWLIPTWGITGAVLARFCAKLVGAVFILGRLIPHYAQYGQKEPVP
ncbi:MAG: oligosaccharide flippase family protein [Anaerolineales bacterium]|nr:oligosaccharide flippase family protein [Anaerolineales bacterium]